MERRTVAEERRAANEEMAKKFEQEQRIMFMDPSSLDVKGRAYYKLIRDHILATRTMRGFTGELGGSCGFGDRIFGDRGSEMRDAGWWAELELVGAMAEAAASSSGSSPPRRLLHGAGVVRDALPYGGLPIAAPPPPIPPVQGVGAGGGGGGGGGGKISPAVLFIIVILAVVFFISGLLHLLVRLLMKKQHRRGGRGAPPASSSAARGGEAADAALQRQLQQLFHLHDAGLDQAFIDALPVFAYREIVVGCGGDGDKEPFDCAVCLCEFDAEDRLRLLLRRPLPRVGALDPSTSVASPGAARVQGANPTPAVGGLWGAR
ncbi:hypothetical protein PR202_gb17403 [Eleusine coracana subsp. coracana]|uniref:Uncharacterized protein n=1 Tax=Eleusine coracana subsp. coracana TaxID=191504 RepID=A0AAV5F0K0_ELECO|nr:hypothetical protein PR202_gb17403 [Eleusine coracana subsp. coracana]